jgi:hypothetical protein
MNRLLLTLRLERFMADPGFVDLPGTRHFSFSFNQMLNAAAATALGSALAATAEQDFSTMSFWFGGVVPPGVPFQVKINLGTGGASNDNVKNINLRVGQSSDADLARSTLVAEVIEIFMAASGLAWHPGDSSGEGLSQAAAFTLYPDEMGILNGPGTWLDTSVARIPPVPSRPDFVSNTDPTDANFVSFGCALLFIYYLRLQLGFSMKAVVEAAANTLEGVYINLTQDRGAFAQFLSILEKKFPSGAKSNFPGSNNPFPLPSGATLSARRFFAETETDPKLLSQMLRSNKDRGDMRALLNSNRPAALVP